jgi:hypothetical protein
LTPPHPCIHPKKLPAFSYSIRKGEIPRQLLTRA